MNTIWKCLAALALCTLVIAVPVPQAPIDDLSPVAVPVSILLCVSKIVRDFISPGLLDFVYTLRLDVSAMFDCLHRLRQTFGSESVNFCAFHICSPNVVTDSIISQSQSPITQQIRKLDRDSRFLNSNRSDNCCKYSKQNKTEDRQTNTRKTNFTITRYSVKVKDSNVIGNHDF